MAGVRAKIAHLSDLHFGFPYILDVDLHKKSIGLPKVFDKTFVDHLADHVVEQKPHIIIVSGDLANNPSCYYMRKAREYLIRLLDRCGLGHDRLILLPGNHDVSFKGNFGFKPLTSVCFEDIFEEWTSRRDFYDWDLGLFIYWFDSNPPRFSSFARGIVTTSELFRFRKTFSAFLQSAMSEQFVQSLKIAVLHHHPVPIPYTGSDKLLMLDRAGNFLSEMLKHGVDLILHGHKHHWGFSRIAFHGREGDIAVLAGGTAAKLTDEPRYNLVTLYWDGTVKAETFRAPQEGGFDCEDGKQVVVVGPPEARARIFLRGAKATGRRYRALSILCRVNRFGDLDVREICRGMKAEPDNRFNSDLHTITCSRGYIRAFKAWRVEGQSRIPLHTEEDTNFRSLRRRRWQVSFEREIDPNSEPLEHEYSYRILNYLAGNTEEALFKYGPGNEQFENLRLTLRRATEALLLSIEFEDFQLNREAVELTALDPLGNAQDTLTNVARQGLQVLGGSKPRVVLRVRQPYFGYGFDVKWALPRPGAPPLDPQRLGEATFIRNTLLALRQERDQINVAGKFANLIHGQLQQISSELHSMASYVDLNERIDVSLMAWDAQARVLRIVAGLFAPDHKVWDWTLPFGDGLAGRAMKDQKGVLYVHAETSEEWDAYITPLDEKGNIVGPIEHEFLLSMPMVYWRGSLQGVLGVLNLGSNSLLSALHKLRSSDEKEVTQFARWLENKTKDLT